MLKIFRKVLKNRTLATCFATAAVFFSMTVFLARGSVVKAYPYQLEDSWYYTDETHTTQCGFRHEDCKGRVTIYGTVTPYDDTTIEQCY
ncbi:MAG: hypothetical protein DMF61_07570 [Blastocatellia bacterium AA13]|nr:MAG: hypothetical protein DMF61_07570 [Blastocatellia bacterium AA13]